MGDYRDFVHIEDISPTTNYSCDIVALVVKKWSSIQYCDVHITDFTVCKRLAARQLNDGPSGHMTLKLEVHEPHKGFVERQVNIGQIVHFSNVRIKWNRDRTELESTLFRDKWQQEHIHIEHLSKNDPRLRAVLARKDEYFNPTSNSRKGSDRDIKRKRKREAQKEEIARLAGIRDQDEPVHDARNAAGLDRPAMELQTSHSKLEICVTDTIEPPAEGGRWSASDMPNPSGDHYSECKSHLEAAQTSAQHLLIPHYDQAKLRTLHSMAEMLHNDLSNALKAKSSSPVATPSTKSLKLLPRVFPGNDSLNGKIRTLFYHGSIAEKRGRPWLLTQNERNVIQYPSGFKPHDEAFTGPLTFVSSTAEWTSLRGLANAVPREESSETAYRVQVRIVDFYPDKIEEFVDSRTSNFNFWLRCADESHLNDASKMETVAAVRDGAAETLLGMSARDVLEGGAEVFYLMRARLNRLWGDLELLKLTYIRLHPERAHGRFWASQMGGLQSSSPILDIGLVLRSCSHEVSREESVEWQLQDTHMKAYD